MSSLTRVSRAFLQLQRGIIWRSLGRAYMSTDALDLNPTRGTRDFYPPDQKMKNWLFNKWRNVAELHGFEEYDSPVVESEALYIRKAGEEITDQLYTIIDKSNRKLALRPEMTPSLARMVMAQRHKLKFPIKWYSIPQCWRYERMSRGRRREHYQWNMDIWGVAGIEAEVELLECLVDTFQDLGLTSNDVGIKVNNRKILDDIMNHFNIPSDHRGEIFIVVDKMDKLSKSMLLEEFAKVNVTSDMAEALLECLTYDLPKLETFLGAESSGVQEMQQLLRECKDAGIESWLEFNSSVVRGLSYYTGTVFEGFDRSKTLRAICGGGRYDNLVTSLGSPEPMPAVGFGFGDAVVMELLKDKELLPNLTSSNADILLYTMIKELKASAYQVAQLLRKQGLKVDMVVEYRKPRWAFERANKLGIEYVVIIAPDEHTRGLVTIKNMMTGKQSAIDPSKIPEFIAQKET